MNKLRRAGAVVIVSMVLAVSSFAGTIDSPGVVTPPPPPSQTTSTSSTITVILTVLSLVRS